VARLAGDGATIRAFDPEGMQQAQPLLPNGVIYCRDAFDAAEGADALVLITEWNEFRALSPTRLRDAMRGCVLVDLRNVYDPVAMRQARFHYHCVGRPEIT
jgi:UDPglucose 6-dehydrogenase